MILIDRRLTYTAKRCVLTHELLHWKHGDDGCANDRSKQERRCRTQTALLLVNPTELALLERMYEYEWQIADELNITTQVLEDYRSTLDTNLCSPRRCGDDSTFNDIKERVLNA